MPPGHVELHLGQVDGHPLNLGDLAVLAAADPRERRDLLVGLAVDVGVTVPVAVVDGAGPPERPGRLAASKRNVAVVALRDLVGDESLAVALGRVGEAPEVAAAARVAVAELEIRGLYAPGRHAVLS